MRLSYASVLLVDIHTLKFFELAGLFMKPEPLGVEVSLTHNMRLTIFHSTTSITVEVKRFNHHGEAFFTFHAELTEDLVDYLSRAGLIYTQPTKDCYQLPRTVEFKLE